MKSMKICWENIAIHVEPEFYWRREGVRTICRDFNGLLRNRFNLSVEGTRVTGGCADGVIGGNYTI